ncbi:MAG: dTDP-4-dehydrorhamnose reductase [Shimia sp.]
MTLAPADILVFGRTGQVATELGLRGARCLSRAEADLTDPAACAAAIRAHAPAAVINAAAYTAVDRAEDEEALATTINGTAPGAMAAACTEAAIPFVQISTDYVFDGTGDAPWRPDDPTAPLGAYGRSKRAGEEAVRKAGGAHAILRTSWVISPHGTNFVKTMLRLSETRDALRVVADQVGAPTGAGDIAAACLTIAGALAEGPHLSGTYHFQGAPEASWAEVARATFAAAERAVAVEDIPSSAYPTPAARPLNSRLDCIATRTAFGIAQPDWRATVADIVKETIHAA